MWFKVDDHLHASRKAAKAGVPAMGLWVLAGSWSAAEELDGFVPAYMVDRLAGADSAEPLATLLVLAGLWVSCEHDGEPGYRFHAWDEYQPTRDQLDAKRAGARERMQRVRANSARSAPAVTHTPTRPDPTPKTPAVDTSTEFAEFWAAYPRKVAKPKAEQAYTKAAKDATPAQILAGLTAQLPEWRAGQDFPKYVPHPATWLNAGRWADETTAPMFAIPADRRTLAQCQSGDCPGTPHSWADNHNRFHCQGA